MSEQNSHLDALQDIRNMMSRSSRFISLSGLSGIAAGIWALIGVFFANKWISDYYDKYNEGGYENESFEKLKWNLLILAAIVLGMSLISAFYFTWRRAGKNRVSLWDRASRMLAINLAIPLITGGLFILAMLQKNLWTFVAPSCLIFYGLALVNGGKYTLSEIRYLGLCEIVLGLIATQLPASGIYLWAIGFGVLHIIYGFVMWWKYERNDQNEAV